MNTIKLFLFIFFIGSFANAQDKIVPIPFEYEWPLSSSIIDSVEYFKAKNIANNKVKFCIKYDDRGISKTYFFYDKLGRLTREQYFYKDGLSYEKNYIRNIHGQTLEETLINYSSAALEKFSINKYEYSDNRPVRVSLYWNSSSEINEEAVYEHGSLSEIINNYNSKKYSSKIYIIKDSSGIYNFIGDNKKYSLFENAAMDSVVVGDFTRTFYKIENHRIVMKTHHGVDYYSKSLFYYDTKGLLNFSEDEHSEIYTSKSKSYYTYYYYED